MTEELKCTTTAHGEPEFDQILHMADVMRDSVVSADFDWSDPTTTAKAITAAAMFAGMMFGQMIAIGLAADRDRRRAGEMVLKNFRQGTDAGKKRAFRIAGETSAGGLKQ
jgi:hypothetical protein